MVNKIDLKNAGLKVTLPRMKVLQMLENAANHHLSAEEIHRQLNQAGEEVGLATVYRVLTQFETAGLVKRHRFSEDHSIFELDYGDQHNHMVCILCGAVVEFKDPLIEQQMQVIAKENHFKLSDHSLYLYGKCANCIKK